MMPFIVSSNADKADAATRRLIRSHVMRGKKQNRTRPSKRQLRREQHENPLGAAYRTNATPLSTEDIRGDLLSRYAAPIPRRVGTDFSFIEFADKVETEMIVNVVKFSTFATRIIFPLLSFVAYYPTSGSGQDRLFPIAQDAPLLHITTYAVECFIDRALRRRPDGVNTAAQMHFQRGVALLRQRLREDGNDREKLSDFTIATVVKLASAAHFNGYAMEARRHMLGLAEMVRIRGGVEAVKGTGAWTEMLRCDLSIALLGGQDPVLFDAHNVPPYPEKLILNDDMISREGTSLPVHDDDLATAWRVIRRFCLLVDVGRQTHRLLRPELVHDTMVAVTYRLLRMRFAEKSVGEVVRQGLLVFCYHVFLQWQDVRPLYKQFPDAYKTCIMATGNLAPQMMFWLYFVGAVSVWDLSTDAWLTAALRKCATMCRVRKWKDAQAILNEYAWISALDDQVGKQVYDGLDVGG